MGRYQESIIKLVRNYSGLKWRECCYRRWISKQFLDGFQRLRKKSSSSSLSSAVIQKRKENMPLMTGKSSCNEDTLTPISRKRLTVPSWVFLRYRNSSFISRSSAATGSGSSPLAMGHFGPIWKLMAFIASGNSQNNYDNNNLKIVNVYSPCKGKMSGHYQIAWGDHLSHNLVPSPKVNSSAA